MAGSDGLLWGRKLIFNNAPVTVTNCRSLVSPPLVRCGMTLLPARQFGRTVLHHDFV